MELLSVAVVFASQLHILHNLCIEGVKFFLTQHAFLYKLLVFTEFFDITLFFLGSR